ncbi:MAG TPA: UDP-N-acetylmuramoyl-L-alanyl-D-glutamate--2,6-diaminopimelate ligase [Pirellulaceae bacterium]|nr:UDP-N-acetylmuramoyl-L-alanyl-D-glutamate--2,6-diaminopimelate ligase [Pirellulaceae bacterium]
MLQATGRLGGISLRQTLSNARVYRGDDIVATRCSVEAKRVRPGDLFVALAMPQSDGHNEIDLAIERGASAILSERLLPIDLPHCVVPDSREALGRVCQELAGRPTEQLQTIGVAGTQGKTITSLLIASVLEAARKTCGVISTIGYSDGAEQVSASVSTPPAPELANWLSRMVLTGSSHAVVEVSRQALAERRIAGMSFDAAVLTSLRPSAFDEVGSLLNERQLQSRLIEQLKTSGFVIANADDVNVAAVVDKVACPVMTYGLYGEAEVTATILERHLSEQTFLLHAGSETIPVCTHMLGDHHVQHCLAAASVGLVLGIPLHIIARGLEAQRYMPGRLERLECGQPFGVFVDYARTPEMLTASLKAVRQVTQGRVICVTGAQGESHKALRPLLGRVLERMADKVIITSDSPRGEEPLQIAHEILDGMTDVGEPRLLPNRAKAIEWALSQARPGDTVLIAGKGDQDKQIIGKKQQTHDDREIARDWLYNVGAKIEYPQAKFAC